MQLSEPLIAGLVAKLRAGLNAQLDTVNAQNDDGTLVAQLPDERITDYVPPVDEIYEFPLVAVGEGPGTITDDTGYAATGSWEVAVVCFASAVEQQEMTRQLRRLRQAVVTVVLDGRNIADAADPSVNAAYSISLRRVIPGRVLAEAPRQQVDSYLSWTTLVFACLTDDA